MYEKVFYDTLLMIFDYPLKKSTMISSREHSIKLHRINIRLKIKIRITRSFAHVFAFTLVLCL